MHNINNFNFLDVCFEKLFVNMNLFLDKNLNMYFFFI